MARRARPARRLAAAGTLLAAAVTVPACGDGAVSPLPARPPTPTTAAASPTGPSTPATTAASTAPAVTPGTDPTVRRPPPAAAPPTRSPATTPARPPSPSTLPSACLGAVRYDLVLAETELALVRSLCFGPGGVLRVVGIGPGEVTVDRPELVSRAYEAGVQDLRFLRAGTVEVTIPHDGRAHVVAVVVT